MKEIEDFVEKSEKFLKTAEQARLIGDYGIGFILTEEEARDIRPPRISFKG